MALTKTPVQINFSKGLDLKTDPFQIPIGMFASLTNSVFTTAGRLTKRNGYQSLTPLPSATNTTLTTFAGGLVATGPNLNAYSADLATMNPSAAWLNKGTIQPISLATTPLLRTSTSQSSPDSAISANGLVCFVYMDNSQAYYQVSDSFTGEQVVTRTALPASAVFPRVFVLGNYFVVTFLATVSAASKIQYIAIPVNSPTSPTSATTIGDANTLSAGYDGLVYKNQLYIGWNDSSSSMIILYMTTTLALSATSQFSIAVAAASVVSIATDSSADVIYMSWSDGSASSGIYSASFTNLLVKLNLAAHSTSYTIVEMTSIAQNGHVLIFYEISNTYGYDNSIETDCIASIQMTQGGTFSVPSNNVGSPASFVRSVGLASKAFIGSNGTIYMLATYGPSATSNQPSYFLIDNSGNTYMRLAYSNGGGYAATQVLPSVSLNNGTYFLCYLLNDFLATVNKGTNLPAGTQINAIYTQQGISLAAFEITNQQFSSEIAGSLHLTGGQLWQYDGVKPVEHGFHVWPENVEVTGNPAVGGLAAGVTYFWQFTYEWTDNQGKLHRSAPSIPVSFTPVSAAASFTADRTSGSPTLTSVSSFTGLQVGQAISGTGIASGAYILALNTGTSTITMSANATSGSATSTTITPTTITSVTLYVPYDRLTYKVSPNPARVVGYRWSSAQEVYYQFTSLPSPTANSTISDYATFTDSNSDSTLLGNVPLYTLGGVIEDIAAPASIGSALFDNRLWLIDAEDQNLLWFSKEVIESVPVEMSDLLTYYVAPTTSAQGSTGPVTAIYPMDDKLILFKKNAIYYLNGTGPDNTGNNNQYSQPIFITTAVGCTNPNSIVLMKDGLMFQSDKGIWLLGRDLNTNYIGAPVEGYNTQLVVSATMIPGSTQVRFVLSNNITLMYDYFYMQWGTHTNILGISSTLYQGLHTYLNSLGQVFQELPGTFLDGSTPVLMSLTTPWMNVAGLRGYERFYFMYLLGTYFTPFKLNVSLAYDYNPSPTQSIVVTPDNFTEPWGDEQLWGNGQTWGGPGNAFQARLFPQHQKCQTFQVTIQEIYDSSMGQAAGQGLSLSGMNLVVGLKKGYSVQKASRSFG